MFSSRDMAMASPSSIFSPYASMTAYIMLLRSITNDLIPQPIRCYLTNTFRYFFKARCNALALIIEEYSSGIARNHVYDAAEVYLSTKITPENERLNISKSPKEKKLSIRLEKGEEPVDWFNGVKVNWKLICSESEKSNSPTRAEKKHGDGRKQPDVQVGHLKYLPLLCYPTNHHLFGKIEGLIEDMEITPAQVAEELMKSEDADTALEGFLKLLKRKKMEGDVCENDGSHKKELRQSKRSKVGCKQKRPVCISKRKNGVGTQRMTREDVHCNQLSTFGTI
ncbi:hypothetical protein JHK87_003096 [Glycine soja]|nr:hypothetical protein JHK87_003096 [Glycine soja]